jgi:hypothetical protein
MIIQHNILKGAVMPSEKTLTREAVIQAVVKALRPVDYVHALYEGGAAAFRRIDEWSDIDLYIIVDENRVEETFQACEDALASLSGIQQKYEIPQTGWPGVYQAFYKLENTSEYLIIDLAILTPNSQEKFLEPEIHGNAVFHLNKNNSIKLPHLDTEAFAGKLHARALRLKQRFRMFNIFVQKEINRGNTLEAIDLYHVVTLASLIEALRIKHNPLHHDFKLRYAHYELPEGVVKRLESLSFVKDQKDLQEKYTEASKWFSETISEINCDQIERRGRSA